MSEKTQEKNQSEGEYFAVVATGRKGVETMMEKMAAELREIAAPNVSGNLSVWQKRAIVWITGNEDLMQKVCNSRAGLLSVYQGLARAATMGMQAGGNFPHFYLVPKDGKATFVPSAEGLSFAATYGTGGVLARQPKLVKVYENDTLKISEASGDFEHIFDPRKDRGKLALYLMRLEYKDGRKEIAYVTAEKVRKISDAYSAKEFGSGKKAPAWTKSEDEMLEKIAAKKLLKKAAAESEGLSMLITAEEEDMPEPHVPPVDVGQRVTSRLDEIMERAIPVEAEEVPEPEDPAEAPEPAPAAAPAAEPKGAQMDIF